MAEIVSVSEFCCVATVLNWTFAHAPAARLVNDTVIRGELRGLLPTGSGDVIDARDRLVRFTDTMGFEYAWPVRELAADLVEGGFGRTDGVFQ